MIEYYLLSLAVIGYLYFYIQGILIKKRVKEFDAKMNKHGYTEKIVVYDFLSKAAKKMAQYYSMKLWTVGIWLSPQKEKIALRLESDNWNEIEIPFDKIQSVEIIEDGMKIAHDGPIIFKTTNLCYSLQVRIVAGDISSGIKAHIIKLWESEKGYFYGGVPYQKNGAGIQECARLIRDVFDYVVNSKIKNTYNPTIIENMIEIKVEGSKNVNINTQVGKENTIKVNENAPTQTDFNNLISDIKKSALDKNIAEKMTGLLEELKQAIETKNTAKQDETRQKFSGFWLVVGDIVKGVLQSSAHLTTILKYLGI